MTTGTNFKDFLEQSKENWGQTVEEANKSNFVEFPDGKYVFQLASAELRESKKGLPMIMVGDLCLEGDYAGQTRNRFVQLGGTQGMKPLVWFLNDLAIEAQDIDLGRLEEVLAEIVERGYVYDVTLKTKGDFQNMRVNALIPDYELPPDSPLAGGQEDDAAGASTGEEESSSSETVAPEPEVAELKEGSKVTFEEDGKSKTGIVQAINEEAGTVDVKVGLKKHTVAGDQVALVS